jgi:hypothetical protein
MSVARARTDPRATLIHEWDHGKERYRLVAVGRFSAGYEDKLILEKLGSDGLGEPSWSLVMRWETPDVPSDIEILISAIKSLRSAP